MPIPSIHTEQHRHVSIHRLSSHPVAAYHTLIEGTRRGINNQILQIPCRDKIEGDHHIPYSVFSHLEGPSRSRFQQKASDSWSDRSSVGTSRSRCICCCSNKRMSQAPRKSMSGSLIKSGPGPGPVKARLRKSVIRNQSYFQLQLPDSHHPGLLRSRCIRSAITPAGAMLV